MPRSPHRKRSAGLAIAVLTSFACAGCASDGGQTQPQVGNAPVQVQSWDRPEFDANTLDREAIRSRGAYRFEQLLEGKLPGVSVLRRGNGELMVKIRGINTFSGNTNPLFLLDGMPIESRTLLNINPADVERIEVIKDGTAAFYGSRGGNGVILITTIRPG